MDNFHLGFSYGTRLRSLIFFFFCLVWILPSTLIGRDIYPNASRSIPCGYYQRGQQFEAQRGLIPLTVHDMLMEVAGEQANALAATEGAIGHKRPGGMTLGQELLLKGFPLWGDLSQDGYRSENWSVAMTAEDAISMWLGDDEHANTMLSEYQGIEENLTVLFCLP